MPGSGTQNTPKAFRALMFSPRRRIHSRKATENQLGAGGAGFTEEGNRDGSERLGCVWTRRFWEEHSPKSTVVWQRPEGRAEWGCGEKVSDNNHHDKSCYSSGTNPPEDSEQEI